MTAAVVAVLAVAAVVALVGTLASVRPSTEAARMTGVPTPDAPASARTAPAPPPDPLAGWSLEQKVGQLFMVGVDPDAPQPESYHAVRELNVGNIFLAGRSSAGAAATAEVVRSFTTLATDEITQGTPFFVATDQEGGSVQVLTGPGFSDIPPAVEQAALPPEELRQRAERWGGELAAAGVNLNLGPVMDLVPAGTARENPPIGAFRREYGSDPGGVIASANAFSDGMEAAGVEVALKHFPGLGRVAANTDVSAGVTDTMTRRDDPSVDIFAAGIDAGAAFVMTATAFYEHIDPDRPAAFSPAVIDGILRDDLGFEGVVISDDLSAAEQAQQWSPAERATLTIEAGGDMVLASADPSVIDEMVTAVVARAREDEAFAERVDAAVERVLTAKERLR